MKVSKVTIIKLFSIAVIFMYVSLFPIYDYTNTINAVTTLVISIILLLKSRENLPLSILFMFILYINYSIVIGEYIIKRDLYTTFLEVKSIENYGLTIRIMLLFMSIITILYKEKSFDLSKHKIEPVDNYIAFYVLIFMLVIMLFFGLDRSDLNTYSVRISPLFEYSKIVFLFAFYFSGKSFIRRTLLILLMLIFIIQDVYYGGRVTTLQLLILFSITVWVEKLTYKKIISYSLIGIFFNSLVGAYRISYSLAEISLMGIIYNLTSKYFVFSTAIQAYYSSVTHIAASKITNMSVRFNSLFEFIKSVFLGSGSSIEGNVTLFVDKEFFNNIGGGMLPTHFYFWLGWSGVLIIAIILISLINGLNYENNVYQKMLFFGIIINAPRWYLYSPNQLFRGTLIFITILWLAFWFVKTVTTKKISKERYAHNPKPD